MPIIATQLQISHVSRVGRGSFIQYTDQGRCCPGIVYSEANDRVAAVIIALDAGRVVYTRDDATLSYFECFEQVCDYGPGYFIATETAPLVAHNAEAAKPGNLVVDHTGAVYLAIAHEKAVRCASLIGEMKIADPRMVQGGVAIFARWSVEVKRRNGLSQQLFAQDG